MVSSAKMAVSVDPLTVTIWPPGLAVTLYAVIADPPLDAGAAHVTSACVLPAVAVTLVGAPGAVAGGVGVWLGDGVIVGASVEVGVDMDVAIGMGVGSGVCVGELSCG